MIHMHKCIINQNIVQFQCFNLKWPVTLGEFALALKIFKISQFEPDPNCSDI